MSLILRKDKNTPLTFDEMDGNLEYLDNKPGGGSGIITEPVKIELPNDTPYQIGSDGDAINLNVIVPPEYSGLVSTFTGFDYNSAEYSSFIGVLKGLNFAPLDFINKDMVGTFTIEGNPFDPVTPNGNVMIDGLLYDGDEVVMEKVVLNFTTSGISINANTHSKNNQSFLYEGDNGELNRGGAGNNNSINDFIEGENGKISRIISNPTTGKVFYEEVTDTKYGIAVDDIKLNSDVEIQGSLTNVDGSYYVKSTDLPKKLINFSGEVSTLVLAEDPETIIFSYKITPDMWKTMSAYELSILGSHQASATNNRILSLYMNTTNSVGGSKLWNGIIATNNTATPFGGTAIAIEKKLWKDSNVIMTEGGNTTSGNTNTNTNFDSGVNNNAFQKYLVESTLDFTNDIWLILTTDAGNHATLTIKKLLLREI